MGTKTDPGRFDCHGAAAADEPIFTLRANDPLAPDLVREWAARYLAEKAENALQDTASGFQPDTGPSRRWTKAKKVRDKVGEALKCARDMEEWRRKIPEGEIV